MGAHDLTSLFIALAVLLASARAGGEIARRLNQPEVLGEILAGVALGPTVLGRLAPGVHQSLFAGAAADGLAVITSLAVALFLFTAGMEVNLATVRRQGARAVSVSLGGLVVPAGLGFAAALYAPQALGGSAAAGWGFPLFMAAAMSISALPVIARTLIDLGLYRTEIGMLVVPAAILQDLIGWLAFAVVLSLFQPALGDQPAVVHTITLTLGFVAIMLTGGRWLIDRVLPSIQAYLSWPGGVLGFAFALALACAAFTESIGLHAIFGAFVAGVALGDSPHLRVRTRATIEDFVRSFFAPLFFAGIGLHVDLIAHFAPVTVAVVFSIACVGKLVGCGLGARLTGLAWRETAAVALALNARGAMEIIVAAIALRFAIIGETTFVALVVTALATSLMAGPLIQRVLGRRGTRHFAAYLAPRAFVRRLRAHGREGVIRELVTAAGPPGFDPDQVVQAVLEREAQAPTAVGRRLALPHARLPGLPAPLVAIGLAPDGIPFDEGEPARIIALVLTPSEAEEDHLGILAGLARDLGDAQVQARVMTVRSFTEFLALVRAGE